jgi:hypothetical protein
MACAAVSPPLETAALTIVATGAKNTSGSGFEGCYPARLRKKGILAKSPTRGSSAKQPPACCPASTARRPAVSVQRH